MRVGENRTAVTSTPGIERLGFCVGFLSICILLTAYLYFCIMFWKLTDPRFSQF